VCMGVTTTYGANEIAANDAGPCMFSGVVVCWGSVPPIGSCVGPARLSSGVSREVRVTIFTTFCAGRTYTSVESPSMRLHTASRREVRAPSSSQRWWAECPGSTFLINNHWIGGLAHAEVYLARLRSIDVVVDTRARRHL
jgi:hypothetical protein